MKFFNPQPKKKIILLEGKAYTEFRMSIALDAYYKCETCNCWAPPTINGVFDVFKCGHLSHIKPRKKVGDIRENVKWECYNCHIGKKHGPRWSK